MKILKKLFSKKQKILCMLLVLSVVAVLCYAGVRSASAGILIQTGTDQPGGDGWTYDFRDNELTMKYTYHYVSQATLSYETTGTIWANEDTDGFPREAKHMYYKIPVKDDPNDGVEKKDWSEGGKSYTTIKYSADVITELLTFIHGELKPDTEYTVYLSEVYSLKSRPTANDKWVVDEDVQYFNVEDIRNAAAWTQTTKDNFINYYDIELTFVLEGASLDIVYVDVDTGDEIQGKQETVADIPVGYTKDIPYSTDEITKDGKKYAYTGIELVYGEDEDPTGSWEAHTGDYTFKPTKEGKYTLYVGYSLAGGSLGVICVDMDTNEVLKKYSTSFTGVLVPLGESQDYTWDTKDFTVDGTSYTYAGKMQIVYGSEEIPSTWSSVENGTITFRPTQNGKHILFVAYKKGEAEVTPGPTETPTPVPTNAPTPTNTPIPTPAHVCTFVWGDNDAESHWYVCKDCGKQSEKHAHVMVKTDEVDEKGNVIRTCECSEHPECEFTDAIHVHEYIEWAPDYREQEYYYPEDGYEEQGYVYDPDIYHWRYCAYNSCTATSGRTKHKPGEYVSEGDGYSVLRCKECNWILDKIAVTVSLSISPNGGTFPNGSKDILVLDDALEYGSVTDLGKLGPEYWVTFEDGYSFAGFYIVEVGNSECFYYPDHETQTCLADSKFFYPLSNGTYLSSVTKSYILYAQKSAAEYTVRYNANGGTGLMYDRYHKVGVEQALSPNGFQFVSNITYNTGSVSSVVETTFDNTRVVAGFTGWGTNANGPAVYADKQVVLDLKKGAGIVNLYAIWDYGTIILPNATATDGGSKLSGWMTEDGTFISVLNDIGNYMSVPYTLKGGDETLTAVWIPNQYKVSFDSDGGTACDPIMVTYKKTYNYNNSGLPTTSKEGYTFLEWVYKPTMESITNNSIVSYPMDHTLTAQWKVNDVIVYLDYTFHFEQTAQNPNKNSAGFDRLTAFTNTVDKMVLEYDSYYGVLPQPTMDGYTFAGWYKEKDSAGNGCGHQECLLTETGSRVTTMNTHTLYARWVKEQYRVDLDYNYDYSIWEDGE